MVEQEFRFVMSVNIQITGTETRKNNVRDVLLQQLQSAKDTGNIDKATWSISQNTIPEGGTIS